MSMTPTLVSVNEYLRNAYHPDRDYIDGELLERNMGETPHGKLQMLLGWYFLNHSDTWRVTPSSEQRVQISPTRYRIPDACLIANDAPDALILRNPPVLCVEILSRGDSMTEILARVFDYAAIGVPAIWVIDPWLRRAFSATPDGTLLHEPDTLTVPNTPIEIPVPDLFRRFFPDPS